MNIKYKYMNIIGSDETGVGDYLTPLVAAAVFVPYEKIKELNNLGVDDSKKMSDKKIMEIAFKLRKLVKYSVKHLTQKGYNKLNKSFNANELKMFLHMSAINNLEGEIGKQDLIIIDKFSTSNSIKKYYKRLGQSSFNFKQFKTKLELIEKAESEHVAVAAASILARAFLIESMQKQNKNWNTIFPFGTNQIVEEFITKFVAKHGIEVLPEVAKISFKTTKKLFGGVEW